MRFLTIFKSDPDLWKGGLRTAAAAGLSFVFAEFLALQQGYWSVLSAILITQATVGGTLEAAANRWLGTLAGAALGFVLASLIPPTTLGTGSALVFSSGALAMLAMRYPSFRIAPMTAAILLLAAPTHAAPWISALHRVIEITLGCCVGVVVALVVVPSRADAKLRAEAGRALGLVATLIKLEIGEPGGNVDEDALAKVSEDIYAAYNSIDALTEEVRVEHISRLSHTGIEPKRLRHSMRDLRAAAFVLRHVTRLPWPAPDQSLIAALRAATEVMGDYVQALGAAVAAGKPPPPMDDLDRALAQFATTAAHRECAADPMRSSADDRAAAFVSTCSVALEQMRRSLGQLVECCADMCMSTGRS